MQVLINNDDAQIDVRVDGSDGDTIVLIHGFPFTSDIWEPQVRALSQRFRVVRPDLRGMGNSRVVGGPYLMEALAGDIAVVLDALGAQRVTLVGHSLGGFVALAFARMYAERIQRLALACSRLSADTPQRAKWRNERADFLEKSGSIAELCDEMIAACIAPQRYAGDPEFVASVRAIAMKNRAPGLAAMLRGMAMRTGAEDIAPDLDMPVLIAAGAADPTLPLNEARAQADRFGNARVRVFEHSGHLPMLEEPDQMTACLTEFLSG
jgi:pimeloyl-ACP methyl ester carboxylesterase